MEERDSRLAELNGSVALFAMSAHTVIEGGKPFCCNRDEPATPTGRQKWAPPR
jgi:hypothetical protein